MDNTMTNFDTFARD